MTLNSLVQEQEMAKEFWQAKNYAMHKKSSQIQIPKQNVYDHFKEVCGNNDTY